MSCHLIIPISTITICILWTGQPSSDNLIMQEKEEKNVTLKEQKNTTFDRTFQCFSIKGFS